jgi:hypothetical protein
MFAIGRDGQVQMNARLLATLERHFVVAKYLYSIKFLLNLRKFSNLLCGFF